MCDCGQPKLVAEESCDRCAFLDGRSARERAIIDVLRDEPMTATELSKALQINRGYARRLALRLAERGRVVVRACKVEVLAPNFKGGGMHTVRQRAERYYLA